MVNYGIQIGKVVFVGLLSVIVTADVVVGLEALYYWQLNRIEASDDLYQRPAKVETMLTAQRAQLADYRVVDAKKNVVAIPIGRAMDLTVSELSRRGSPAIPPGGESR
jgi:hypothetical protein